MVLIATTMYCLPSTMYVIGDPLCGAGVPAGGLYPGGSRGTSSLVLYPESAEQQSPGPQTSTNGRPSMPVTYRRSDTPGGGSTSDRTEKPRLAAGAYATCVSGSNP